VPLGMHEASLVSALVESLLDLKARERAKKIVKFQVAIGELSGVDQEAFNMAYEALKGVVEELRDTRMEIIKIPARLRCEECQREFSGDYFSACPECGSYIKTIVAGEELELREVELEV